MAKSFFTWLLVLLMSPTVTMWAQWNKNQGIYPANGCNWYYRTSDSEAAIYNVAKLSSTVTELKFPDEIIIGTKHYPVTTILHDAVSYRPDMSNMKLVLPNSLKRIESSAFRNTDFKGNLIIPEGVEYIGSNAFYQCYYFSGPLIIPSSVKKIGDSAFGELWEIESVTFAPNSSITMGTSLFTYCYALKYIDAFNVPPFTKQISRPYDPAEPYQDRSIFLEVPRHTLVYLPAGSRAAEAGEENFIIGNSCDNLVVYDLHYERSSGPFGSYYKILHPFTANKATYKRYDLSGTNCKTLCLPYPATLPNGMRAYELKARTRGGTHFRFVSIGDGGTRLEANKPYLVRITDGSWGNKEFGIDNNVSVPVTPSEIKVELPDGNTSFWGTVENIDNATLTASTMYGYYNLKNNEWRPITTANPNGYVHSFRAYIRTTGGAPAKGFAIVLDDENETTGIDDAEEDIEKGDGKIYSLDGKLLGTDINVLKSGEIYIKNGKKFYKF